MKALRGGPLSASDSLITFTTFMVKIPGAKDDHFLGGTSVNDVMSVSSVMVRSFLSVLTS